MHSIQVMRVISGFETADYETPIGRYLGSYVAVWSLFNTAAFDHWTGRMTKKCHARSALFGYKGICISGTRPLSIYVPKDFSVHISNAARCKPVRDSQIDYLIIIWFMILYKINQKTEIIQNIYFFRNFVYGNDR